ncbi:hypothetical protein [Streptomyces sp. NPDC059564]
MASDARPRISARSSALLFADDRLEITLLRDEFANLHLGSINH